MAMNLGANTLEKVLGHDDNATIASHISNPSTAETGNPADSMRALTWQGKNTVELVTTNKPKIIDGRDVLLKITGTTICGSDLHLYHGAVVQLKAGDILGHEFCGVVEEVGPEVDISKVRVGERYVTSFQIACGDCKFCKMDLSSMCDKTNDSTVQNIMFGSRTAGFFGYSHFTGGFAGGQSEYVRVPYGDVNLLHLPSDVPDEKGLYLSDVLATSYHAVKDTCVERGDVVAIWGAGPIGLMAAVFAQKEGAKRVILVDQNWRLGYAKSKLPEIETLDYSALPRGRTVTAELHERVPGGVDVAIECVAGEYAKGWAHYFEMMLGMETDTSEILNEMITSTRKFGRCGITGAYVGFTNHFNIGALMERGIRLIGNGQAPVHRYWKELLGMIQSGELDPTIMLSHRVDLEDMEKLYTEFDKRSEQLGLVKVFVQTKHSALPAPGTPQLTRL